MSQLTYRPDVDGLRAMAILPVVLFHAGIGGFSGGYVGVDVFFVISGYLITSIIMMEVQQGSFSYSNFWARRARRILPASVLMMVFALVAGWFVMAPLDYFELGRSARSQAYFAGNFYFWQESGYFEGPSELKPLLHTWSLAVEEQFYLCFPLVFMLLHRLVPAFTGIGLLLVALASLIYSQAFIADQPSTIFYLLPGRAWELLLGSLVAVYGKTAIKGFAAEVTAAIGLLMILYSVVFFDASTAFPGVNALYPTVGTAMIIWANSHQQTRVSQLLSMKFFVGVGLISYSLYLWHWPVLVFARYVSTEELHLSSRIILVIVSFVLGYISWRYVEAPFRKKKLLPNNRKILTGAAVSIVCIAIMGQLIRRAEGYPPRLPEQALAYAQAADWTGEQKKCADMEPERIAKGRYCGFNLQSDSGKKILFWGDSHMTALYPAVKQRAQQSGNWVAHLSSSGCAAMAGALRPDYPECVTFNQAVFDSLDQLGVDEVVLANRWSALIHGARERDDGDRVMMWDGQGEKTVEKATKLFQQRLSETLDEFRQRGIKVWLVKQVPFLELDAPHVLTLMALKKQDVSTVGISLERHRQNHRIANDIFALPEYADVSFLDPTAVLCRDGFCPAARDNISMYRDDDHLSVDGAFAVSEFLGPVFGD